MVKPSCSIESIVCVETIVVKSVPGYGDSRTTFFSELTLENRTISRSRIKVKNTDS